VYRGLSRKVGYMTHTDELKDHRFTAGLSAAQLARLTSLAREVSFAEDELILLAGQQSRRFYLLLTGSVCIEAKMRAYTVCVQALGAGDAFGWSAFLDRHDTLFQVRARERSTALYLERPDLAAVFQEDSVLAAEMLRRALTLVAGRVEATEAKLAEFCGMRVAKEA
jgi:CRP-like cAMP-binding protein